MRIPWIILALIFLNYPCAPQAEEQYDLIIENGTIIDLETGLSAQKTIYISKGKIKKISPSNQISTAEAKQRLDASNTFILPGFWDNHVHFRGGDSLIEANKNFLKLFLANGITTVRDAGGDLTAAVMGWKTEMAAGELRGPNIFTSGPKIDGLNGTWAGSLAVENEHDIQKALDSLEKIPTDFVKLYDSRITREAYLKTIAETERRELISAGHMPFTVTLEETVAAGIDAIEHLYYIMKGCSSKEAHITEQLVNKEIGFWDAMPALMSTFNQTTASKTFETLKENNVFVVPTLHIGKTLSYLDEVDHSSDPYLKLMDEGIIKTYEGRINRAKKATKKAVEDRKALDAFFGKLANMLNKAQVGILAGSDSGAYNSYTYPGISLHQELQEMVSNGFTPLEALQTSAYNGARFLKQEDYGNVEEGKIADLVLLEANPLEHIENTQKIHTVIKNGQAITNSQRKRMLSNE